jgi:mono/diheme cytochrome c family protein
MSLSRYLGSSVVIGTLAWCAAAVAQAETAFTERSGESIFKGICQGCHMPDAGGAVGAGVYPGLARNPNLAGRGYPLVILINGRKAMPAFGDLLSDEQIAAVVNYIRSHFGNQYPDEVSVAEVKAMRQQSVPATKRTL